ncbi:MAG: histidine kinase [Bacteroidota bacterium]
MKLSSETRFALIFHLVLWTIWFGLPFASAPDDRFRRISIALIPVTFTNIPLFLANSDWLIPYIFRRRGLTVYFSAVLVLIAVFAIGQGFMKESLIPPDLIRHHWDWFWFIVPVIFVTALSTGYGFIRYMLAEEKARQEEQQERLKSEVSFLRTQISPHFIFNVLNSIVYLIRSKSEQAEHVTMKLSELMRYMLYQSGDAQVALEQEVSYLKNYVELQKIRFEDDVDIRLNIQGAAGAHRIEPMLLIPFVENAFKHGVGLIPDPMIDISLKTNEKTLVFEVLNKIAPESAEDKDPASGIGLKNVRRRLELLYPEKHQLDIQNKEGLFSIRLALEFGEK